MSWIRYNNYRKTMESEQRYYELRSGSRSRSKTPLVQSCMSIEPETLEHHYDLRSRSRERSCTPGDVTNNRRSGPRILPSSSGKVNDQSGDTMVEREKVVTVGTLSEGENKRFENSTKRAERRSERQKTKRQIFANSQPDNKENLSGSKSISPHRTFTSDYSSEEAEQENLSSKPCSAHEIYKQAGDWWNVFPKTDYTYSERSNCRYEIAPGILAMPNMSRRSIHSNMEDSNRFLHGSSERDIHESTNIEKEKGVKAENCTLVNEFYGSRVPNSDGKSKVQYMKTHVEQYRCHREVIYTEPKDSANSQSRQLLHSDLPSKFTDSRKYDITSTVDSDAELDETVSNNHNQRSKIMQQFISFVSVILVWFSKLLEFLKLKTVKRREYSTNEYERYESKRLGIWGRIDRTLQYIYLFMIKVFFFDSWVLSRIFSIRRWIHEGSPKVFWVALLPLLLLTGYWCLPHLSTLFSSTKAITHQFGFGSELIANDKRLFAKEDNFESITEKSHSRMNNIEDQAIEQSDRILNITQVLERLREKEDIWSKYDNKILSLEKRLEEYKFVGVYAKEIDIIKSQLEELKVKLKLCCNADMNHITSEDLRKRIEIVLDDNLNTFLLKTEKVKVGDKSWIANNNNVITDDRVREIVKEVLKVYDADKTGRVDYALESAGGQIISTRCTQRYDIKTRAFKLLAFTLYHENNNPRTVIQGNPIQPGACWAFQGFPGYLLIKLRSSIYVTGFTVEHAPKSILPNGEMKSAPKKFNIWGFIDENDTEPALFGDYEFTGSDSLQYFPVKNTTIKTPYEYVELRVHSNHGQLEYTCLYRFRVHGKPV